MSTKIRLASPVSNKDVSMWVDEAIWGHRLYDEQIPWFIYLEFLNVYVYEDSQNSAFEEKDGYNTLVYFPQKRLYLRNILFNFPLVRYDKIIKDFPSNFDRWNNWKKEIFESQCGISNPNFDYLERHFEDFEDFVEVVKLIHSTGVEIRSNKRWSSKFVFPYSKDALFEDLDKNASSNDRRFFGRTGELLYLMISRSSRKEELRLLLNEKILSPNTVWSKIIKCLQPPGGEAPSGERANGFLPYSEHLCFESLSSDWVAILKLQIPGYDMTPFIITLAGWHILHYQQVISRETIKDHKPSYFVCEIVAPKKTLVRTLSIDAYQQNNNISLKAVTDYINNIERTEEWQQAIGGHDSFVKALDLLRDNFKWPKDNTYEGSTTADALLQELRLKVKKRHQQHVGNVHRVYGREIGLISKRGTNRLRYAPSDDFLKTLILANVHGRMELHLFLKKLFDKYQIVIGASEAEKMVSIDKSDIDTKAFQANAERLELRLSSIGLLRRLSDGCAYVLNPHSEKVD